MRRFKNSGIFKNTSLSFDSDELYFHGIHSASYDRLIVGFTHTSGSAKILELKNNKHNDVCLMKRMEWNSCEYETLFTLPEKVTSHINENIYVIDSKKLKKSNNCSN
ncbi:unnamed protein product [Mytilus edulis]|uniref:Uncharacterized protein n=1 Tax=Mytilus edulis TaxID=6550 RepID=A0A8S3R6X0_MYTED|nr:unnamed protein product [Mytilus edulis]